MDLLPGIDELRKDSEEAAAKAAQLLAEQKESLREKARQEQLMQEMAREYYQKMDAVTSPVRCLTSKNRSFWRRIYGGRDHISGHIFQKPGGAANSHIYYIINIDGSRWAAVKDDSTKKITWFSEGIVPYDGKQVQRAGSPSDSWKRALTHNLKRAVDRMASQSSVDLSEQSKSNNDTLPEETVTLYKRILRIVERRKKNQSSDSSVDHGESSDSSVDHGESSDSSVDLSERIPY